LPLGIVSSWVRSDLEEHELIPAACRDHTHPVRFTEICHYGTSRGDVLQKRYQGQGFRMRAVGGERNGGRRRRLVMRGKCWWFGLVVSDRDSARSGQRAERRRSGESRDQASAAITITERI
jgi:hypothetical protein